jgi:hypothetical protein
MDQDWVFAKHDLLDRTLMASMIHISSLSGLCIDSDLLAVLAEPIHAKYDVMANT